MTSRPNVLNQAAIDSFTIHNFIYHILKRGESPDYLEQVTLTPDQNNFFRDKVIECAKGTQYVFDDPDNAAIVSSCQNIIDAPVLNFNSKSRELAAAFLGTHTANSADGIFIVALVSMVVNTNTNYFIALLKVDYTKVLEQVRDPDRPGYVTFHEIVDSLSEDNSSIQKRALIDVGNSFRWDILAVERGKSGAKLDTDSAISDYFKQFLNARLMQNDSAYAKKVPSAVSNWAKTQPDVDSADAKAKAVAIIRAKDGQSVTMDEIRDSVCAHSSSEIYDTLKTSFDSYMSEPERQLSGVQFIARANSLANKDTYTKMKTNFGVTIQWEGKADDANVKRTVLPTGQIKFEILADDVTESN